MFQTTNQIHIHNISIIYPYIIHIIHILSIYYPYFISILHYKWYIHSISKDNAGMAMELIEPLLAEQFQGIFDLHRTPVTSAAQNESTNRKRRLGKGVPLMTRSAHVIYVIFKYIYIYHLCNTYVCYMLFDGYLCVFLSMLYVS